jgi:hypothetical protein
MRRKTISIMLALALCVCFGIGLSSCASDSAPQEPAVQASGPECEHVWTLASFQEPKTCNECGETDGRPLAAFFEEKGYQTNMALGQAKDYVTIGHLDPNPPVVGQTTVLSFDVIDGNEEYEAKEGYEWQIIRSNTFVDDDNNRVYGIRTRGVMADYYTGELYIISDPEDPSLDFSVNFDGVDYECRMIYQSLLSEWTENWYYYEEEGEMAVLAPKGYDGIVSIQYNAKSGSYEPFELATVTTDIQDIVDSDTLFFRLKK